MLPKAVLKANQVTSWTYSNGRNTVKIRTVLGYVGCIIRLNEHWGMVIGISDVQKYRHG